MARIILTLLNILTPFLSPVIIEIVAIIVIHTIDAICTGVEFGKPVKVSKPEQNCFAPKPREVASPNKVARAASESTIFITNGLFFGRILVIVAPRDRGTAFVKTTIGQG